MQLVAFPPSDASDVHGSFKIRLLALLFGDVVLAYGWDRMMLRACSPVPAVPAPLPSTLGLAVSRTGRKRAMGEAARLTKTVLGTIAGVSVASGMASLIEWDYWGVG